ncbi:MAG: hypothetical protein EZS28_030025 [Streblomastix strix]|uniref:Uncharacterized protein n=1 Tax=Streblomastix strix TaxID=222440 RepID=A0A5J4UVF4_9EUKA|nr:MAG: hypothetical protein EZS28_030025 [Streblomastix strix]
MYYPYKGKGSVTFAQLMDEVIKLTDQYSWKIDDSHISGLSNTIPDSVSRLSRCGDYAIKREVLQKPNKELRNQISIDIFATHANRECLRYCSISKDRFNVKPNGLSLQWSKQVLLLHLPISQLLRSIRKVKKERVQGVALIAPDWPIISYTQSCERLKY